MKHRPLGIALGAARSVTFCALPVQSGEAPPDAIVSAAGNAQYKTVQPAVNAAPQNTRATNRWTLLIKPGTYQEIICVQ